MSVLTTNNIIKDYPGTRALNDVNVSFTSGKVNALLGKNGSGKSTLSKIISGAEKASSGTFALDGEVMSFSSPAEAAAQGIAMVYQEMSLVAGLTVAENIFLGRIPLKNKLVSWKELWAQAKAVIDRMGVDIDPKTPVYRLAMWQQQVVEICKALSFNPKVLILDEPTSALAQNEVQRLFAAVRLLKEQDIIIVYITHKLQELPQIADNITVLRDGEVSGTADMDSIDRRGIIHLMFGEVEIKDRPDDLKASDETVMEVKGLSRKGWYDNVNFQLKKGEVLGIAGMLGSGRTELLRGIFGADPVDAGTITIEGKEYTNRDPSKMNRAGMGLTPEDRRREGLIMKHSVMENLCYASMDKTRKGWLEDKPKRRLFARKQVDALEIKVPGINTLTSTLSGGNQQKVVVGNWLNNTPRIILYDEPSRGIDVNAKQQIFDIMWTQAREGIASIFVSTELEELLEVCHRILIMRHGKIEGEIDPATTSIEELYTICMGGRSDEQVAE